MNINRGDFIYVTALLLIGATSFFYGANYLKQTPRGRVSEQLNVSMPPAFALLIAGGDRWLAAEVDLFRAIMVSTQEFDDKSYQVLAEVQNNSSILNPYSEDNYYIAEAIIPWGGNSNNYQYANAILSRAEHARPWDVMPPFYKSFNHMYFEQNYAKAGRILENAAKRFDSELSERFHVLAAKMYAKQENHSMALRVLERLRTSVQSPVLRTSLEKRIKRVKAMVDLENAIKKYITTHGTPPTQLQDVVDEGLIKTIPKDPYGMTFEMHKNGKSIIIN